MCVSLQFLNGTVWDGQNIGGPEYKLPTVRARCLTMKNKKDGNGNGTRKREGHEYPNACTCIVGVGM